MKGISKVVLTSPQLPWVRSWTACPFKCRVLSLSQFSQSSALTFWALIDFLLHITLHFPLEGGCRESTSFSRLLREHGFVLGGAVSCGLGEAPRVRQCWSRSVFFAIIIPSQPCGWLVRLLLIVFFTKWYVDTQPAWRWSSQEAFLIYGNVLNVRGNPHQLLSWGVAAG